MRTRRTPAHSTSVGKLLPSFALPDLDAVRRWADVTPLERRTDRTITDVAALHIELQRIRAQSYAVDDQENDLGINCIALPVHLSSPTVPSGAISVSAVAQRTSMQQLVDAVPEIRRVLADGA